MRIEIQEAEINLSHAMASAAHETCGLPAERGEMQKNATDAAGGFGTTKFGKMCPEGSGAQAVLLFGGLI